MVARQAHAQTAGMPTLGPTFDEDLDRLFRAAWALSGSPADAEALVERTYSRGHDNDLGHLFGALLDSFAAEYRSSARPTRAPGVFAAVAALPAELRDALVAVDVAGLTYADAAKALCIGEAAFAGRLVRARSELARSAGGRNQGASGSSMAMATYQHHRREF